jgi:hypothetical protein
MSEVGSHEGSIGDIVSLWGDVETREEGVREANRVKIIRARFTREMVKGLPGGHVDGLPGNSIGIGEGLDSDPGPCIREGALTAGHDKEVLVQHDMSMAVESEEVEEAFDVLACVDMVAGLTIRPASVGDASRIAEGPSCDDARVKGKDVDAGRRTSSQVREVISESHVRGSFPVGNTFPIIRLGTKRVKGQSSITVTTS